MILGYRVRSSYHGWYVYRQSDGHVAASPTKQEFLSRSEAYRLAADWLDAGYDATVIRVMKKEAW